MEHYYVVSGNEFGINLESKRNFTNLKEANKFFEEVKYDDFGCALMYVNDNGEEVEIKIYSEE